MAYDDLGLEDVTFLLNKVGTEGRAVIISGSEVVPDMPTIHQMPNARHLGFGMMEFTWTDGRKFVFDAGGSMQRLPCGRGWTYLEATTRESDKNIPVELFNFLEVTKLLEQAIDHLATVEDLEQLSMF